MPVAPVTITPMAVLIKNGSAESTATAMPAHIGVWKVLVNRTPDTLPKGNRPSRPIENIRRMVADWIASVQTQMAMSTTKRYTLPQNGAKRILNDGRQCLQ